MREQISGGSALEHGSEGAGKSTNVVRPEYRMERPGWRGSQETEGEPCQGMQQRWEAQWQELLKTLQSPHSAWGNLQLPEATPWDDTKAFLVSFEQVAKACQWPRGEWAARLLPALSGEAEEAFRSLEARDQEDYGKVKAAILRGEALRMESQRQHFRQFCCQEVRDPRRIHSQVQELCRQWLKLERHSKEQILLLLILEQFLASLPVDLQGWIRAGGPDTCSQAVTLAEDFLMSQQGAETGQKQDMSLMNLQETDTSFHMDEQTLRQPGQCTIFWQVLEEDDGKGDALGKKNRSLIKTKDCQQGEIRPENTPRTVCEKNLFVTAEIHGQRGESKGQQGKKSVDRENEYTEFAGVLSSAAKQSSSVCKRGEMPLFSKYGRKYGYKSELLKMHTTEDLYECPMSKGNFQQRMYLEEHQRNAIGGKQLSEFTEYRKRDVLTGHSTGHSGEEAYLCPECGKSFASRKQITHHQRIHTGDKPYECSWCGKRFTHSATLRCHQRIHTGEKPYKCSHCGKCFRHNGNLMMHRRIHTGERPLDCSQCGKCFRQKGALKMHDRVHTGEKPYKCSKCGGNFSQKDKLIRHQRTHK